MVIAEAQDISFQNHSGGKVVSLDEKLALHLVGDYTKYLDDLAMVAGNILKGELLHLAQGQTKFNIMVTTNVSN